MTRLAAQTKHSNHHAAFRKNDSDLDKIMESNIQYRFPNPKATIILAEDDGFLRALLCDLLQSHGYRVVECSGGDAALEMANQVKAEILITDLIMEEGEGISTILKTRRIQKQMKILAVSSNAKYLDYAAASGADCIMNKPIRSDELLANIRRLHCSITPPIRLASA